MAAAKPTQNMYPGASPIQMGAPGGGNPAAPPMSQGNLNGHYAGPPVQHQQYIQQHQQQTMQQQQQQQQQQGPSQQQMMHGKLK